MSEVMERPRRKNKRMDANELPNGMRRLRLYRELSMQDLADKVGVKWFGQIARMETLNRGLHPDKWAACARALGVQPWALHNPDVVELVINNDPTVLYQDA